MRPATLCLALVLTTACLASSGGAGRPDLGQALQLEARGDTRGAIAEVERLIHDQPGAVVVRLEGARLYLKSGELDRAQQHLESARALAPDNPRAHYLWGLLWLERGKPDEASKSLEAALFLRPGYDEARLRLAGLLYARGDFAAAAGHYGQLAASTTAPLHVRLQHAAALERSGRTADAVQQLETLHRANPRSAPVTTQLAALYERTGKAEKADRLRASLQAPPKKMRELKRSKR